MINEKIRTFLWGSWVYGVILLGNIYINNAIEIISFKDKRMLPLSVQKLKSHKGKNVCYIFVHLKKILFGKTERIES